MENTDEMQEQTETRKKRGFWGWTVIVIRWLFILLFAVILLGGLYFRAPWKILVLDGLLLALLTIVPKKKRKYGWLALATVVLAVTVWIFIPEKDTGNWRPYTFDEEVATLNAKYGVPEDENAAPYYAQIELTDFYGKQTLQDMLNFDREKKGPDLWDPNDETLSRPWKAEEFPELAAWLENEKEKIAPFWKAVEFDRCWFEIQADQNAVLQGIIDRNDIKKAALIIQRMIYQDLGSNNLEEAVEKSLQLLQCSYHRQQQAYLLDNLVGWSIYVLSTETIRDLVIHHDLNEKSLDALEQKTAIFKEDWDLVANRFLDYEKIQYKNVLGLLYEVNDQGDVRYTRKNNFLSLLSPRQIEELGKDLQQSSAYWQTKRSKLGRFIRWMTYNASLEELSDLTDKVYVGYRERLTKDKIEYQGPESLRDLLKYNLSQESTMKLTTEIAMPVIVKVQKIYRRTATEEKGTLIVIALKRFYNQQGHWPQTLEPIKKQLPEDVFIDSLNGQEIAYLRPEGCDTFILYSFGEDGIDDKGFRSYADGNYEKRRDDFLFWPQNEDDLKQMLGIEEPEEPEIDGEMMEMMF